MKIRIYTFGGKEKGEIKGLLDCLENEMSYNSGVQKQISKYTVCKDLELYFPHCTWSNFSFVMTEHAK